jgi:myosin V
MDDINCKNGEKREIQISIDNLPQLRNTTLNEDRLDDLTSLSYLNDPAVLNTIQCRYNDNIIYTYSGLVLVSLNPYCDLGLYGDSLIQAYSGKSRGELEPHLFAVAEDAFRSMQRDQKNQSIIISGESGAGKTISARYVMRYFASAANAHLSETLGEASSLIESRVLASNPILEAFGNAKTTRNDNSSRFGKYVQIFFDGKDEIIGAAIKTYLLEKTRVIRQSPGERNYHIFYQLLEGSSDDLKEKLKISALKWGDFVYLKTAARSIENVDDSSEFGETVKSLKIAGFSEEIQLKIFKILSAILHLGNLKFSSNEEDSSANLSESDENLKKFADLLEITGKTGELARWFTRKLLITKLESVEIKLTVKQAEAAKDAVAKFLYSKLFDFIVRQLNELLAPPSPATQTKKLKFIGVLDIYGFEKFDTNSFEQFCINYANEKLQHEFNQQVFKLEQELYEREEITWSFINFSDNQPCIDLIEMRGGILDLLDEECRFPNGSDKSFLDKIKTEIPKKGELISDFLGKDPLELPDTFTINHFAYNVIYAADGFLEKNRDLIPNEIVKILKNQEIIQDQKKLDKRNTTGSSFRHSLNDLMEIIQSTQVHYIRCIKPNNSKSPAYFEPHFVMQQLRAGGIIETIKISAAGYPARWSFEEFFSRYNLLGTVRLANSIDSRPEQQYRERSTMLLESQEDLGADEYQIGKTQIFLRAGILAKLEKKRTLTLKNAATLIQSALRSIWIKESVKEQFDKIILIQSVFKKFKAEEKFKEMQRNASALLISKSFERLKAKNQISKAFDALKLIQNQWNSRYKKIVYSEELRHRMVLRIQTFYRAKRQNLIANLNNFSAKQLQSVYKRHLAKEKLKELRKEAKSFEKLQETSLGLEKKVMELTRELENIKIEDEMKLEEEVNEAKEKLEEHQKEIERKDLRIKELEVELVELQETLEAKEGEILQMKTIHEIKVAEIVSLNSEETKQLKSNYETSLSESAEVSKKLKAQYEELKEEKVKLELRFAKVEQYVRTLMTNHIKTLGTGESTHNHSEGDEEEIDKMASQNSLMNFISEDVEDAKLIKFTSTNQLLHDLLSSESILEELLVLVRSACITEDSIVEDQEILLRPSRIIYSWLILSLTVPKLWDLTENRMNSVLERVRGTLSESTDDKKCSLWLTNLINLYGMIHHFIQEKEDQLKQNHQKLTAFSTASISSSPTTQISVSELPPAIILLIRAEVIRLIGDIYSAWLKELCRWFGRAGISAILEYQALPNYKVRNLVENGTGNKSEKFLESVLNSFVNKNKETATNSSMSINELLASFDDLLEAFLKTTLDLEIIQSILLSIFKHMSIICFNQFLLKRNFISWKRAIQIQFNLSRLEDWCRERLNSFGIEEESIQTFNQLLQAVKVIQLAKTRGVDSSILQQCAPNLSSLQIRKLLTNYVPDDFEDGPVPLNLIRQFPAGATSDNSTGQSNSILLTQLDLNKLTLPVALKERSPPNSSGLAAELPLDMPPTLWKLFVLYLK